MRPASLLLTLTTLGLLAGDGVAHALVMCSPIARATGQIREGAPLRLRTACKPNESEIDPVGIGLQGPAGQPGDDGADGDDGQDGLDGLSCWDLNESFSCDAAEDVAPPLGCGVEDCVREPSGPSRYVVVAANGSEVGELIGEPDLDSESKFVVRDQPDAQLPVTLVVHRSTSPVEWTSSSPTIFYAASDCTGQPYVSSLAQNPPEISFYPATFFNDQLRSDLGIPGTVIFYYLTGIEAQVSVRSRRDPPIFSTCIPQVTTVSTYDVGALDTTNFPPPYRIEAR
jgi:hypothetical protein